MIKSNRTQKAIARGFTLIELLVVIAIIGILSAVVLVALNSARTKGNDAGIKSAMNTISKQAALYYDNHNGSYNSNTGTGYNVPETGTQVDCSALTANQIGGSVFGDPNIQAAISNIVSDNPGTTTAVVCGNKLDGSAYVIEAQMSDEQKFLCVDSTGITESTTTELGQGWNVTEQNKSKCNTGNSCQCP